MNLHWFCFIQISSNEPSLVYSLLYSSLFKWTCIGSVSFKSLNLNLAHLPITVVDRYTTHKEQNAQADFAICKRIPLRNSIPLGNILKAFYVQPKRNIQLRIRSHDSEVKEGPAQEDSINYWFTNNLLAGSRWICNHKKNSAVEAAPKCI